MSKIAVVYWSGSGNTESMAYAVLEGATDAGAECKIFTPGEFDASMIDSFDAVAFGCPAEGSEGLEEEEFLPMFEDCERKLNGKDIALFGSYGWGAGTWMKDWKQTCISDGAHLVSEPVICKNSPDDNALKGCRELGVLLAK